LAEILIDHASGLVGRQLGEALSACRDVVPLALRHAEGSLSVGPATSTPLSLGDRLMVVGEEEELRQLGALARA
jgi:K+/H+ antiporter YhaU regulatory subunit KhtT